MQSAMRASRVQRVARRIEQLRTVAYPFANGPLSGADHRALLGASRVRLVHDSDLLDVDDAEPYQLTPPIHGVRELHVNPRICPVTYPVAYSYVVLRALLDASRSGPREESPRDRDRAALAAVMHPVGCRDGGLAFQRSRMRELASFPELWPHAPLSELLESLNAVFARVAPPAADLGASVDAELRAMHEAAKRARTRNVAASDACYRTMFRAATRRGKHDVAVRARLGFIANRVAQAEFPAALGHLRRAQGALQAHDLRELEGEVLHEGFSLAAEWGKVAKAERIAGAALRAYGPQHERIPYLAHDVGFFWRERGGYRRSAGVFSALLPKMESPEERLRVLANLLWSAGCGGDELLFDSHWSEASALAGALTGTTVAAFAYLGMAWGLCGLGRHEDAVAAARLAVQLAFERGEGRTRARAEVVLDRSLRRAGPIPPPDQGSTKRADGLAAALIAHLCEPARV